MRVDNWPLVLNQKVEEWRHVSLEYGGSDCFQFAAEVVLALTGVEHRGNFPRYASRAEAEAIIASHGGVSGIVTAALGASKPVARAMRGDLVFLDVGEGAAVGVCLGVNCCAPGPHGLVFKPTAVSIEVWSV